jgi:hypothetical protein
LANPGASADIIAHIAEVEQRGLYAREAFPSMFVYCMTVLHLSEAEAYLRIAAARASREHPMLLTMLTDGRLHLTAIGLLTPHLTRENRDGLLERATHRSKRQIVELIAEIAPSPDVRASVRKLPEKKIQSTVGNLVVPNRGQGAMFGRGPDPKVGLRPDRVAAPEPGARLDDTAVRDAAVDTNAPAAVGSASPVSPPFVTASPLSAVIQPLSPGRYKVQFTASAELHHKLEKLRALMGSRAPGGDLAAIIEQAVTEKLERLEARHFARTKAPRKDLAEAEKAKEPPGQSPASRHIPAAVRRAVSERDGGRCRYVDEQGRRCAEQNRLEFHHLHPFGLGGDHRVANVALMCRAHNAYLAECDYGRDAMAMARHRRLRHRDSLTTAG